MSAGDYTRSFASYGGQPIDVDLPTVSPLVTAKSATRIITVIKISFMPSTYEASTVSFLDSISGKSIGSMTIPATAPSGSNTFVLDWGPVGTKLTAGANLLIAGNATGRLHIEAVQKGR